MKVIILAGKFSARHMPVIENPWTMNFKVLQGLLKGDLETNFRRGKKRSALYRSEQGISSVAYADTN